MKPSPNVLSARCRCQSGRSYKRCCWPWHEGRPAPSAEALMRSRYCAYALGLADYIIDTTHPEGPEHRQDEAAWRAEIRRFYEETRFEDLEILGAREGAEEATVRFLAGLSSGPRDLSFAEDSLFRRWNGTWRYHSGKRLPPGIFEPLR